jgi:hypothetical protein
MQARSMMAAIRIAREMFRDLVDRRKLFSGKAKLTETKHVLVTWRIIGLLFWQE